MLRVALLRVSEWLGVSTAWILWALGGLFLLGLICAIYAGPLNTKK